MLVKRSIWDQSLTFQEHECNKTIRSWLVFIFEARKHRVSNTHVKELACNVKWCVAVCITCVNNSGVWTKNELISLVKWNDVILPFFARYSSSCASQSPSISWVFWNSYRDISLVTLLHKAYHIAQTFFRNFMNEWSASSLMRFGVDLVIR